MPQPCNWAYLTVKNSLVDLHRVNITFRNLYSGKWVATGISKGGQTTMFYRSYYPDDVDVSVPYVAPLNQSLEDGRHEVFLSEKVGTAKERKAVEEAQLTLPKRKQALLPMLVLTARRKGILSGFRWKRCSTTVCWSMLLLCGSGERRWQTSLRKKTPDQGMV